MSTNLKEGDIAPNFSGNTHKNDVFELSEYKGTNIVLYFYPKDNTPGCTKEAQGFRDNIEEFRRMNAIVIGVSKDGIKSHQNFAEKQGLNFLLLADTESQICEKYSVIKEKSMFGKAFKGIERSTFLIDEKGIIRKVWRKVKVNGHVEEVLNSLHQIYGK